MTEAPLTDHGTTVADRRHIRRRRALIGAQIVFRNGYCSMTGQILDVSDAGALLKPADVASCPEKFALKPRVGLPRDCEVRWRKGETLGVRYL